MPRTISFSLLFIILGSYSTNCWIINNIIDSPELIMELKMEFLSELENEINPEDFVRGFNLIYPGTKWCGSGNIAENYDDLGSERAIDMCCREHDHCEDFISAGETKYNLTNEAFYTRLSCKCDEIFRRCLRATKKRTASNIGTVYFNLLNTQCFKNDYLVTGCTKKGGWLKQKCLQYDYDTNSTKFYQWFDVQKY